MRRLTLLVVVLIAAAGASSGRSSTASQPQQRFFFTPGPNGANCEIDLVPGLPRRVFCAIEPPKVKASKAIGATLTPSGPSRDLPRSQVRGKRSSGRAGAALRALDLLGAVPLHRVSTRSALHRQEPRFRL